MQTKRSALVNDLIGSSEPIEEIDEPTIDATYITEDICRFFEQINGNKQLGMKAIREVRANLKLLIESEREEVLIELDKKILSPDVDNFVRDCIRGVIHHFSRTK